jgi:RTA1 like protein
MTLYDLLSRTNTRTNQFCILFRVVEFSAGLGTQLTAVISQHEVFVYCFDAVQMFFALLSFNILHPGAILVGPKSEFPKRTRAAGRKVRMEQEIAPSEAIETVENASNT